MLSNNVVIVPGGRLWNRLSRGIVEKASELHILLVLGLSLICLRTCI